jgi:hypothetical protein
VWCVIFRRIEVCSIKEGQVEEEEGENEHLHGPPGNL